jgi:outer membrane protein
MKSIRCYVVCLFILAMLVVPYRAFAFIGLDAGVGYWRQTPSGTLAYKPISATDTLDLKDDLNLDSKNRPFVRIKAELPLILPNIYAMYTPMSFDGTGKKTLNFIYGDITFVGGAPLESKIKMDHYDVALFYPIPVLKTATTGVLNVELGLNAKIISFDGEVTGTDSITHTTKTASISKTLPIPMIYVGIQVKPISMLSIDAEVRGIAIGDSHFYDYMGRLKVMPYGPLYISAGYRAEQIKISSNQVSDVNADIKFGGPFIEVGVNF